MLNKIIKTAVVALCGIGLALPAMAEGDKPEKHFKVVGGMAGKYFFSQVTKDGSSDDDARTESKFATGAKVGIKGMTHAGDWTGYGHFQIQLSGAKGFVKTRHMVVGISNPMIAFEAGRNVWGNTYQGEKYKDNTSYDDYSSGENNIALGFFDAMKFSYKGVKGLNVGLSYGSGSKTEKDKIAQTDSYTGIHVDFGMVENLNVRFYYGMFASTDMAGDAKKTEKDDASVTIMALSAAYKIGGIVPYLNYQQRTSTCPSDSKYGCMDGVFYGMQGYTEINMGVEVGLDEFGVKGLGINANMTTKAPQKASGDEASKTESVTAVAVQYTLASFKVSFGNVSVKNHTFVEGKSVNTTGITFKYVF